MAVNAIGFEARQHIVYFVSEWYKQMRQDRSEKEATWLRCLNAFMNKHDKVWVDAARAAGRSHRFIPMTFDSVQTVISQISEMLFSDDEWLELLPMRPGAGSEIDDNFAEGMTNYLLWRKERSGYDEKAERIILNMLIFGNCPWTVQWKTERAVNYPDYTEAMTRYVAQREQMVMQYQQVLMQHQQLAQAMMSRNQEPPPAPPMPDLPPPPVDMDVIYDGADIVVGDPFLYVEDMRPNDPDKALRAIMDWKTREYLMQFAQPNRLGYRRFDNMENVRNIDVASLSIHRQHEQQRAANLGMNLPHEKIGVELITMMGDFEIPDGTTGEIRTYRSHIAVIANDSELIQFEPVALWSGRLPLRNAKLFDVPNESMGLGVVEVSMGLQDFINARQNQVVDAVAAVIMPEMEIVKDGVINAMKPSGPNQRHYVNKAGTINPIPKSFQGIPLGMSELRDAKADFEQITGAVNVSGSADPRESATKTARNTGVISARLSKLTRIIERQLIKPSIELIIDMEAQYQDKNQFYIVTQDGKTKWADISPQQIRRGWLVKVAGTRNLMERQQRAEQGLGLITVLGGSPLQQLMNMPYILEQLIKDMGFRNVQKMLSSDPNAQAMYQQMLMSMMNGGQDESDGPDESGNESGDPGNAAGYGGGGDAAGTPDNSQGEGVGDVGAAVALLERQAGIGQ